MGQGDQFAVIIEYIKVIAREAYENRIKVAVCFAVVSLSTLLLGHYYPKTYESSATLYADQQNIIRPLLSGQAAVTRVQDQNRVVRELIHSPRILRKVAINSGLVREDAPPRVVESIASALREQVSIQGIGGSHIKLSYGSEDPERSFNVMASLVDVFIRDTAETKRTESREAYEFIDKQVRSYKVKLQQAEENLKAFRSASIDGNENTVKARIAQLRSEIERAKLDIEDSVSRVNSINSELGSESQFVARRYRAEVYRERLALKQQELDSLLLVYTETYPDVVALKLQIEDLNQAIVASSESSEQIDEEVIDDSVNPLYNALREKLSDAKIELEAKKRRLVSTKKLLSEELERLKRIAEGQAELSELTRDYNVNKGIYEDMLERKERARLSMALDIEGQGVSYKIQEPAHYPLTASGLRFMHFAVLGPFIGVIIPLGLLLAYVVVDPRIRFISQLRADNMPVVAVVPHVSTPIAQRMFSFDVWVVGVILAIVALVYGAVAYTKLSGFS